MQLFNILDIKPHQSHSTHLPVRPAPPWRPTVNLVIPCTGISEKPVPHSMLKHIVHPALLSSKYTSSWTSYQTSNPLTTGTRGFHDSSWFPNSWDHSPFPLPSATNPASHFHPHASSVTRLHLCLQTPLPATTPRTLRPSRTTLSTLHSSLTHLPFPSFPLVWGHSTWGHPFLSPKTSFYLFHPLSYHFFFFSPVFCLSYNQVKKCEKSSRDASPSD